MDSGSDYTQNYRTLLIQTWQKTQDDIDKAVISLSGGALGVSFIFLKDIIGPSGVHRPGFLLCAWVCWALSTALTLLSFLTSRRAFSRQIKDIDDEISNGMEVVTVQLGKLTRARRWCSSASGLNECTSIFNTLAAVLFVVGVILMIIFTFYNLEALSHVGQK